MRLIFIIGLFTFLSGCSYIHTPNFLKVRDTEYLRARSAQPLNIPPGISTSAFSSSYPVPYHNYPQNLKAVSLEPPGLYSK